MKVLVLIVVLLFVGKQIDGRAIEASTQLDEDDEACIEELHLNRDEMESIDTENGLPENNEKFATLMACSGKRQGLFTSTDEVNYDGITHQLLQVMKNDPETTPFLEKVYTEMVSRATALCKDQHISGTTPGLTLIKSINCVVKGIEQMVSK